MRTGKILGQKSREVDESKHNERIMSRDTKHWIDTVATDGPQRGIPGKHSVVGHGALRSYASSTMKANRSIVNKVQYQHNENAPKASHGVKYSPQERP